VRGKKGKMRFYYKDVEWRENVNMWELSSLLEAESIGSLRSCNGSQN